VIVVTCIIHEAVFGPICCDIAAVLNANCGECQRLPIVAEGNGALVPVHGHFHAGTKFLVGGATNYGFFTSVWLLACRRML